MKNKKLKRYKKTTVKEKRNVVRSLTTFSEQYDSAFIEDASIEENGKVLFDREHPLTIYFDDFNPYELGVSKHGSGMIYSKEAAKYELSDYSVVTNEVDHLISINRKQHYKDALKKIVQKLSSQQSSDSNDWITYFFEERYRETVTSMISDELKVSESFASKLYNQLSNRIKFRYAGIYHHNDEGIIKLNELRPTFLTPLDVLKHKIEYIKKREWLLSDAVINQLQKKLHNYYETDVEEDEPDILDKLSIYYGLPIYETDDAHYGDAIEILKYHYYQDVLNHHYELELWSEEAKNWEAKDAIEYIHFYNEQHMPHRDIVEDSFEEEQARERYQERFDAPIEEETVYDDSLKDEFKTTAKSINSQWKDFYDVLFDGLVSDNDEDNEYYQLHIMANELLGYYNLLIEKKVFSKTGSLNQYCTYAIAFKNEIKSQLGDVPAKRVNELFLLKKKEWQLLYDAVMEDGLIYGCASINHKNLSFI